MVYWLYEESGENICAQVKKMPPREKEFDAVCLVIDVGVTSAASGFLHSAIKYSAYAAQISDDTTYRYEHDIK